MNKKIICAAIPFCVCLVVNPVFSMTGLQIMERNDRLPKEKTALRESVLLIVKEGKSEKKEFVSVLKRYGETTRSRMNFTYPTRIEFLVWDEPGKDSIQWIKLSSGKVRKIASSDKDKPWMNSHSFYEDIGEKNIRDYTYRLVGEDAVDGKPCYRVESVKARGTRVYSKTVVYVGKDDFLKYRIDFYQRGTHIKTVLFKNIEKIAGIYTTRKMEMIRTDGRGKSILYLKSVKYNLPVSDRELTREGF